MPGKKIANDQTYLTELVVYRNNILAADATPDDDAIPEIRLDIDTSKQRIAPTCPIDDNPMYEVSSRAYNGHLELYVHFDAGSGCTDAPPGIIDGVWSNGDARCHATIQVWAWGAPYDESLDGQWCIVHEQSVNTDTLIPLRNIPNTKYKVTVQFMNGTGSRVDILEQHTV
jgi:hypothetical protein